MNLRGLRSRSAGSESTDGGSECRAYATQRFASRFRRLGIAGQRLVMLPSIFRFGQPLFTDGIVIDHVQSAKPLVVISFGFVLRHNSFNAGHDICTYSGLFYTLLILACICACFNPLYGSLCTEPDRFAIGLLFSMLRLHDTATREKTKKDG